MRQSSVTSACCLLAVFSAVALIGGCDSVQEPRDCSLIGVFSFDVTLVDSLTQDPVLEEGARVFVQDDDFIEELFSGGGGRFRGVNSRAGVYAVSAVSPSYEPWVRADVRVVPNRCNVDTAILTAKLVPLD
ncbi:MAG: hypothetical protein ACC682_17075 [Gemmatimonadota bacterium]